MLLWCLSFAAWCHAGAARAVSGGSEPPLMTAPPAPMSARSTLPLECRRRQAGDCLHAPPRARPLSAPPGPPQGEHFGIVPLEAMAAARPVVACDSGGPRESVLHGSTGFLCRPDPVAVAAAMAQLTVRPGMGAFVERQAGPRPARLPAKGVRHDTECRRQLGLPCGGLQCAAGLPPRMARRRRRRARCGAGEGNGGEDGPRGALARAAQLHARRVRPAAGGDRPRHGGLRRGGRKQNGRLKLMRVRSRGSGVSLVMSAVRSCSACWRPGCSLNCSAGQRSARSGERGHSALAGAPAMLGRHSRQHWWGRGGSLEPPQPVQHAASQRCPGSNVALGMQLSSGAPAPQKPERCRTWEPAGTSLYTAHCQQQAQAAGFDDMAVHLTRTPARSMHS